MTTVSQGMEILFRLVKLIAFVPLPVPVESLDYFVPRKFVGESGRTHTPVFKKRKEHHFSRLNAPANTFYGTRKPHREPKSQQREILFPKHYYGRCSQHS
jgi:hypothetical protein